MSRNTLVLTDDVTQGFINLPWRAEWVSVTNYTDSNCYLRIGSNEIPTITDRDHLIPAGSSMTISAKGFAAFAASLEPEGLADEELEPLGLSERCELIFGVNEPAPVTASVIQVDHEATPNDPQMQQVIAPANSLSTNLFVCPNGVVATLRSMGILIYNVAIPHSLVFWAHIHRAANAADTDLMWVQNDIQIIGGDFTFQRETFDLQLRPNDTIEVVFANANLAGGPNGVFVCSAYIERKPFP